MPWIREDDGLVLNGNPHYDVRHIRHLIVQLRQSRNQPKTVCDMLDDLLASGSAPKKLIWRLSKWCHWDHWSAEVARMITGELFHGIICWRLLDQQDRPIPNKAIAEANYQRWLKQVIAASHAS
jgi:hypothetical protein